MMADLASHNKMSNLTWEQIYQTTLTTVCNGHYTPNPTKLSHCAKITPHNYYSSTVTKPAP